MTLLPRKLENLFVKTRSIVPVAFSSCIAQAWPMNVQQLPSLTCWHLHSVRPWQKSRRTAAPTPTVQKHARSCCQVHFASFRHSRAYSRCISMTAAAKASDQGPAKSGPSPFDRLLAVSMYCLPLYEGVWRYVIVYMLLELQWLV